MKQALIYLIYGDKAQYIQETRFSILSAWQFLKSDNDTGIIIYTNHPEAFQNDPVITHTLCADKLKTWAGPDAYFHRSKNRVLAEALDHYNIPLALIDTDTIFKKSPQHIFDRMAPGKTVMFAQEGPVCEQNPDLWKAIQNYHILDRNNHHYGFGPDAVMWNSGVVGMHPQDRPLLDSALDIVDDLYARCGVFNVEQFGLGEVLRRHTNLTAADDIVIHYWGFTKPFFHRQLDHFFAQNTPASFEQLLTQIHTVNHTYPRHPLTARLSWAFKRRLHRYPPELASISLALKASLTPGSKIHGRDKLGRNVWRDYAHAWIQNTSPKTRALFTQTDINNAIQTLIKQNDLPTSEKVKWQKILAD